MLIKVTNKVGDVGFFNSDNLQVMLAVSEPEEGEESPICKTLLVFVSGLEIDVQETIEDLENAINASK